MAPRLEGKVALVAGATRGAGRGIAVELGAAGATVYVTGRSARERRSEYDRPETIEETADLVDRAGGQGIPVRVDHLESDEVRDLVRRIDGEQGRLDVLVNDVWGGERLIEWNVPVWEHSLEGGLRMLRLAIDTHIITSHYAVPLLIRNAGGLVVEMTAPQNTTTRTTGCRSSMTWRRPPSSAWRGPRPRSFGPTGAWRSPSPPAGCARR